MLTKIRLGKTLYTVRTVRTFPGAYNGLIDFDGRTIDIATHNRLTRSKRTAAQIDVSLWHEVTHGVLADMAHPLYKNERFVTAFSTRLAKAIAQVNNHADSLVAQRTQGLRKLRSKVPRSTRSQEVQNR